MPHKMEEVWQQSDTPRCFKAKVINMSIQVISMPFKESFPYSSCCLGILT